MNQLMSIGSIQRNATTFVAALVVFATCGFVIIEGWSFLDSIYMTLITLSTVGYGEAQPLTTNGRAFASLLVTVSLVSMACWTAGITSVFVSGEVSGRFQRQRELKMISKMNEHTIVCGGGTIATTIIRRLCANEKPVVVVTSDQAKVDAIKRVAPNACVVFDDPKSELAMADANILSAKYLIAAVESDFDNLLITITGKSIGTDIHVISCAQSTELASRMLKVGADEVICPQIIGGEHVAELISNA